MSNLNHRSSYTNFVGAVSRGMLLAMGSSPSFIDNSHPTVTYDGAMRSIDLKCFDFEAFQNYLEALVLDGVPGVRLNDNGDFVPTADNQKEIVNFRKEAIRKTEALLVPIESVDIEWQIWLQAEMILALFFASCKHLWTKQSA